MSRKAKYHPNLFLKRGYNLKGRQDWLRTIDPQDRAAFVDLGLQYADHGRLGGIARSDTAKRDWRGRFIPDDGQIKMWPDKEREDNAE